MQLIKEVGMVAEIAPCDDSAVLTEIEVARSTEIEKVSYIAEMLKELAGMADTERLKTLHYLIQVAYAESELQKTSIMDEASVRRL